jgi:chromate transporter
MKIASPIVRGISQIAVAALVFGMVILAHLSLPFTMLLVLPLSILLAWRQ